MKKRNHDELCIDWSDGLPAPQAVLDLLSCNCSKNCKLPKCVCMLNKLKCTDMCKLPNCSNQDDELETKYSQNEVEEQYDFYGFE